MNKKFLLSFRVLHQEAKTSGSNAITPRLQQYGSPSQQQHQQQQHQQQQQEQFPSRYASKNRRYSKNKFNNLF